MRSLFWGILLVSLGSYLLAAQFLDVPRAENLWPVLIIFAGLAFFWEYLKNRVEDTLIPATILTMLGAFFLLFTLDYYPWDRMEALWPFFIIIPGVAFLVMFLVCHRLGVLVPAFVLFALGGAFLAATTGYLAWVDVEKWWPSVLIAAGLLVLWKVFKGGKSG